MQASCKNSTSFCHTDLNPGSKDWDEEIKQFQMDNKMRIDINEFASIYEQEVAKKKATIKDMMEALKAVDPQNGELGRYLIIDIMENNICRRILFNDITVDLDIMNLEDKNNK